MSIIAFFKNKQSLESSILVSVFLPLSLGITMLGMGLSLSINDFRRIFKYPKAVSIGLLNQIIVLPIVAYFIVIAFNLSAELAVGIMILSACPGGATSNLISHVAKGDTALSITLTAFSSVITVITIPIIVNFAIISFIPGGEEQQLNVFKTISTVVLITVIPVLLGMMIRSKFTDFSDRMQKPVKILSMVLLVAIIGAAIIKERDNFMDFLIQAGPAAFILNVSMLAIGFFGSKFLKLGARQSITVAIETGIQNGTLGIAIAATIVGSSQMTIPPAIYSLIMFLTAGVVIFLGNKMIKD